MANEKRLIDANKIMNGIALYAAENAYLNDTALDVLKMVAGWLNEAPTVDAVEVVRCKDCKHLKYGYQFYNPLGISLNNDGDAYVLVDGDDFCSCGERRDNGEEEKDG